MATGADLAQRARRLALENALSHGGAPRPGPIVSRLLATDPTLRGEAALVGRTAAEAVHWVASLPASAWAHELEALGGALAPARTAREERPPLPDLPGAVPGKVVLRMAPFPSGALHVGNARMIFVNRYYRARYGGQLLLVFDDTVGSEEKRIDAELFPIILDDLVRADATPDAVYYKSDRLPVFYRWGRRIIDAGGAYVCTCSAESLRENRKAGRGCPERDQPLEATLDGWEGMLGGRYAVGEAVLRLRSGMDDPDPAFRDRVLFRLSDLDHPRVGRRYKVWPMLEMSWAADDIELGMTHVIRGKDLQIEDRMQQFIWKLLGLSGPSFLHWGILRVAEAKISKSKSYQEVRSGLYDGWADPRSWSLRSLYRRGIGPAALEEFTLSFGLSLADIEVPAETLYAINRVKIDPTTPRRAFAPDPVRVQVRDLPEGLRSAELANHPDRPELGRRTVTAGPDFYLPGADVRRLAGEEVRLKDLLNVRLGGVASDGSVAAQFLGRENRKLPRLQWVGAEGAVPLDVLQLDGGHLSGLAEASLGDARPGEIFQFERFGFVRVEDDLTPGERPVRVCYGHP